MASLPQINIVISSLGDFAKVFGTDVWKEDSIGLFGIMQPSEKVATACKEWSCGNGGDSQLVLADDDSPNSTRMPQLLYCRSSLIAMTHLKK